MPHISIECMARKLGVALQIDEEPSFGIFRNRSRALEPSSSMHNTLGTRKHIGEAMRSRSFHYGSNDIGDIGLGINVIGDFVVFIVVFILFVLSGGIDRCTGVYRRRRESRFFSEAFVKVPSPSSSLISLAGRLR